MRRLLLVVLTIGLFFGRSSPVLAQEKKNTQITEIGGRTLEYWIGQIPLPDQSKSENAIRAVQLFGPERAYEAVPAILDRLRKHTQFKPQDLSVRVNGVLALGVILGSYREADSKVIKDAVTILRRFLGDSQSILKFRAVQALGRIGVDARDAIPEVISMVKDPSTYETRQAAATALGQIAYDKKNGPSLGVLNALFGALGDGSVEVRMAAVQSLAWLGGPGNTAVRFNMVKALEPLAFKDPEPTVQIWAHVAIMGVTHAIVKDRLDAIAKMLRHADFAARVNAAQALGSIGEEAKSTIPALIETLNDPDPNVVGWTIWALGKMGPAAANALPVLERIRQDMIQPEPVRKIAAEAMETINGKKRK